MSAPAEKNKSVAESGAESPTTARPFEMDDDDVQETGIIGGDKNASPANRSATASASDAPTPPPKPPRPISDAQRAFNMLKEAFPTVEDGVVKAVLTASGGNVEPAFNALLEMTDPDAVQNEPQDVPPQQPPRPSQRQQLSQMEADELYARQLAEHYDNVGSYEARTSNSGPRERSRGQSQTQTGDRERNFLEDDLPAIKENLRQGFLETQTTVNGWITSIKKKLEENFDESEERSPEASPLRQQARPNRRSHDYNRYDSDPQVLSDDFAGMRFTADGSPAMHNRPMGNTSIYRPPPSTSPRPRGERRVGFKDEPEEIKMYDNSPKPSSREATPSSASKASKWQPLSSVDPTPISDNDPFSLGDSEDEREAKEKPKADDAARLKATASEATPDGQAGASASSSSANDGKTS